MIGGKMLEKNNVRENTTEKGGKRLKELGKGEKNQVLHRWVRLSF